MAIFDPLKDKLAEWGLISSNNKEFDRWFEEKLKDAEAGVELEPPWFYAGKPENFPPEWKGKDYNHTYTDYLWPKYWHRLDAAQRREYMQKYSPPDEYISPPWRKGVFTDWISMRRNPDVYVKRAYFGILTDEERKAYFEKWPPSSEEWFDLWTGDWDMRDTEMDSLERSRLFTQSQQQKLKDGKVEPPWITFRVSFADYGWDVGNRRSWKLGIWLLFWRGLNLEQQESYLKKWPPPNEDWRNLITKEWAGKLKHTESWYDEQAEALKWHSHAAFPWDEFDDDPAYEWDEADRNKWLDNIWIPFWNGMSNEKRDDYCEPKPYNKTPSKEWLDLLASRGAIDIERLKTLKSETE